MEDTMKQGCCQDGGECVCDHETAEKDGDCQGCAHTDEEKTCAVEDLNAPTETPVQ